VDAAVTPADARRALKPTSRVPAREHGRARRARRRLDPEVDDLEVADPLRRLLDDDLRSGVDSTSTT
jgi:hypothetical protein